MKNTANPYVSKAQDHATATAINVLNAAKGGASTLTNAVNVSNALNLASGAASSAMDSLKKLTSGSF